MRPSPTASAFSPMPKRTPAGRAAAIIAMKESSAQWREKLHALRQTDLPQSIPVEQVLHFSGHALSLERDRRAA